MKLGKSTRSYIKSIEDYLIQEYGQVKPEWQLTLDLLAENLEMKERIQKELDNTGLFDQPTYRKNPLISTLKDLQATILKQIQQLGISPWSASKIKQAPQEDDTEDFISGLLGEENGEQ